MPDSRNTNNFNSTTSYGVVWSCNEWDPLEEVIVGVPSGAKFPYADISTRFILFPQRSMDELPQGIFPQRVIEETEEDLSQFVDMLQGRGIKVRRPNQPSTETTFSTTYWKADGFHVYCPRDILTVIGNSIIESPNAMRSRYYESFAYRHLLVEYLKSGARWMSAPKPMLSDSVYEQVGRMVRTPSNHEPIFDAANILRCGYDLFFQISCTGNELGREWLQSILGEKFRVHFVRDVYYGSHIDSTFAFLRPGLALCNPARVNESNLPETLSDWEIIFSPPMVPQLDVSEDAIGSDWIGMNIFSLSPNVIVVDKNQLPLIKLLEKHGFEVIPMALRHARRLGGGFHCITLDIRRKGIMENYFKS